MELRPTQITDLDSITHLWSERIALLQQSDSYFTPLPNAMQVWQHQAHLWTMDDTIGFFVAEEESEIRGFVVVKIVDAPTGFRPERIGRIIEIGHSLHDNTVGLGRGLIEVATVWLKRQDTHILTIDVPARYPVEEAFWRGVGAKLRFNQFWMTI